MKLRRLAVVLMILFGSLSTLAEEIYRLNADYFIRSTPRFRDHDRNRVGVLTRGSTFRVIEKRRRSENAYAVRIEIQERGRNSTLRRSRDKWIYMSGRRNFTRLTDTTTTEAAQTGPTPCTNCAPVANTENLEQLASTIIDGENVAAPAPAPAPTASPLPAQPPTESSGGTFRGPLEQAIRNYSRSQEVQNMIDWAMANKRPHSIGLCYRFVKEALANQCGVPRRREYTCRNPRSTGGRLGPGNNLTPAWFGDNRAFSAKDTLKRYGFVNLIENEPYKSQIRSPEQAPKGAVLVYSSGRPCRGSGRNSGDCGHIEIKTGEPGQPGYVSDYALDRPINRTRNGGRYRLVGVMIKPGVQ